MRKKENIYVLFDKRNKKEMKMEKQELVEKVLGELKEYLLNNDDNDEDIADVVDYMDYRLGKVKNIKGETMKKVKDLLGSKEIVIKEELIESVNQNNIDSFLTEEEKKEIDTLEDLKEIIQEKYNSGKITLNWRNLQETEIEVK